LNEAIKKANEKWKENNKEKQKYYQLKSQAKRFIKIAKIEDIEEIKKILLEVENE
jgi:hypothetical protein